MSNELISLENESQDNKVYNTRTIQVMGNNIRVIELNGVMLFSIPDLYDALGLANSRDASKIIGNHGVEIFYIMAPYGNEAPRKRLHSFCDEPNMYTLLGRSSKPKAKEMTRVIHEIVAEYRQKGYVAAPEYREQLSKQQYQLERDKLALKEKQINLEDKQITLKDKQIKLNGIDNLLEMMEYSDAYSDDIIRTYKVVRAETALERNLPDLKPKIEAISSYAEDIGKRHGISSQMVGRIFSKIFGTLRRNIPGYCQIVIGKAAGHDRTIQQCLWSVDAEKLLIRCKEDPDSLGSIIRELASKGITRQDK